MQKGDNKQHMKVYTLCKKIKSKENTMAIFSGDLEHRSVNQTDKNTRINLNINLKNVI